MDDELLAYYLRQPPPKRRIGFVGWCVRAFEWAMLIILGVFVMFYILPLVGAALTGEQPAAPPAQASDKKPAEAPFKTTNGGGGGGGYTTNGGGSSTLPPCSQVTDTTTACQQDAQAPAVVEEAQATPAPVEFAPIAVECWQGSFYTCEELAEMGEERAVEAVQTTDAFLAVETLPTPAPAFVEYATNACAAAAVKSPLCP